MTHEQAQGGPEADAAQGTGPRLHRRESSGSTQDETRSLLRAGELPPLALFTRDQRGGRGRLGRPWSTPPGAGLALTLAHRSPLGHGDRSWYPLVTGLGVLEALRGTPGAEVTAGLKWPNDVLTAHGRKLGGILLEGDGAHDVLVGIGLNILGPILLEDPSALPPAWLLGPGGIGRRTEGADGASGTDGSDATDGVDAADGTGGTDGTAPDADAEVEALAAALADRVERELALLDVHGGDAVASGQRDRYRMACLTLGREVRFHAATDPGGPSAAGSGVHEPGTGTAIGIDDAGRLVLRTSAGRERTMEAGDVRHLRTLPGPEGPEPAGPHGHPEA